MPPSTRHSALQVDSLHKQSRCFIQLINTHYHNLSRQSHIGYVHQSKENLMWKQVVDIAHCCCCYCCLLLPSYPSIDRSDLFDVWGKEGRQLPIFQKDIDDHHADDYHLGSSYTVEVVFAFTFVMGTLVTLSLSITQTPSSKENISHSKGSYPGQLTYSLIP